MTTGKMKMVRETEKAVLLTIAFKYNSYVNSIIFGEPGNQRCETGRLVDAWVPKSVLSDDGKIAGWFCAKLRRQYHLSEMNGDVVFF